MKKISLLLLLALSVLPLCAAEPVKLPPKEKFYLVMLTGQSNMAGRGKVAEEDKQPVPRILMQDREGNWVPAVDPVHYDKSAAGVGLARTFAQLLAETDPDITIGLIPTACGGSGLAVWQPGKFWKQTDSNPFDDAVARVKKAQEDGVLKAILFHQGEADCGDANSKLYHDRLKTLLTRFRSEFGAPEVPIVIGQLSQFPDKPWSEGKKRVDAAQRAMTVELPKVGFATSEELTSNPDKVHFDAASLKEFGRRYFKAYQGLTGK